MEALVTQVCLRSTETEGFYTLHSPQTLTRVPPLPYSRPEIRAKAFVDCTDTELLSRIESQPWSAIKLFSYGILNSYWMLVDRCDPVAWRIGLIRPDWGNPESSLVSEDHIAKRLDLLMMDDLKAERRWTRIE